MKYQIDQSGKIEQTNFKQQKTTLASGSLTVYTSDEVASDLRESNILQTSINVNNQKVDLTGIEPAHPDFVDRMPHQSRPTNLTLAKNYQDYQVDKKKKPDKVLRLEEVIRALKKTDGRLRECLSTLVDVQTRSIKTRYHKTKTKSRKGK